jgi:hypothetical protein
MEKEVKEFIEELFLLVHNGDFANGNDEGGIDEGRVRAGEMIDCLDKQWAKLKVSKTPKQIVSGYHRPVCPKCHCELRPETNGVGILDMADWGPYELYDADLWKCPKCGIEVVGGFAFDPISQHFEEDFGRMVDSYRQRGLLIENKG